MAVMVKLRNRATGDTVSVFSVDAREMIDAGGWEIVNEKISQPTSAEATGAADEGAVTGDGGDGGDGGGVGELTRGGGSLDDG